MYNDFAVVVLLIRTIGVPIFQGVDSNTMSGLLKPLGNRSPSTLS